MDSSRTNYDTIKTSEQKEEVLLATLTPYPLLKRGPMYEIYAQKREQRLREKRALQATTTPPAKKKVSFDLSSPCGGQSKPGTRGVVARSVPDLSAILRKENRSPNANAHAHARAVVTPPTGGAKGVNARTVVITPPSGGAKGVNARTVVTPPSGGAKGVTGSQTGKSGGGFEKKVGRGTVGRSSYANLTQLKSLSRTIASAINEQGKRKEAK